MQDDPRNRATAGDGAKPPPPGEGGFLPRQPDERTDDAANGDMDGISRHDFGDEPQRKAADGGGIDYRHLRNAQCNRFDEAYRGRATG